MKNFLLLSTLSILIASCSFSKKPEFKYVDIIEVKNLNIDKITLNADAVFNNPNNLQGKLSIENIHLFVDNIDIGVIRAQEFDVPAKKEFTIPLEGTFSLSQVYTKNKSNLLNSVLKVIQTDSINVQYKGIIRYHLGNFSFPYNINKEQKISIK